MPSLGVRILPPQPIINVFLENNINKTTVIYQALCVFLFSVVVILLSILDFKSNANENYKPVLALLKTRSDEQIKEIGILQEKYHYQQQEIAGLKTKVTYSDSLLRKDIEDLKQQQNPPIKLLKPQVTKRNNKVR
jgi:hypothetical protein